jgi:cell division protein ZapA
MGQVTVSINERRYEIACDDGQEAHLTRLSKYIDKRVAELVASVGQIGDARLLVMASLLIADELSEVYTELENERSGNQGAPVPTSAAPAIESLANRLEKIAERLEQT